MVNSEALKAKFEYMPSITTKGRQRVYDNIAETIGNTPLVRLNKIAADVPVEILAKLEFFNPLSSVKDRLAFAMIEAAEQEGRE